MIFYFIFKAAIKKTVFYKLYHLIYDIINYIYLYLIL